MCGRAINGGINQQQDSSTASFIILIRMKRLEHIRRLKLLRAGRIVLTFLLAAIKNEVLRWKKKIT